MNGQTNVTSLIAIQDEQTGISVAKLIFWTVILCVIIYIVQMIVQSKSPQKIEGLDTKIIAKQSVPEKKKSTTFLDKNQLAKNDDNLVSDAWKSLQNDIVHQNDDNRSSSYRNDLVLPYNGSAYQNDEQLAATLSIIDQSRKQHYDVGDQGKYGSSYSPLSAIYSEGTKYV
jgi:hypothetical protein